MMAVDDVVLQGRIDLWFEDGGELILVDYKTDDVDQEGAAERAESYALQLRLYALALKQLTGHLPDRAVLSFLRPEVDITVSLEAEQLTAALECVRRFRQAQAGLAFPLQVGNHCRRCSFYRGLCPA